MTRYGSLGIARAQFRYFRRGEEGDLQIVLMVSDPGPHTAEVSVHTVDEEGKFHWLRIPRSRVEQMPTGHFLITPAGSAKS